MSHPLEPQWKVTRDALDRAYLHLQTTCTFNAPQFDWYCEYLRHNELELALDSLADLAEKSGAAGPAWNKLAEAAETMSLTAKANAFKSKGQVFS
jgi:hypothetical protein